MKIPISKSGVRATLSPHFISTWNSSFGLNNLARIFLIHFYISSRYIKLPIPILIPFCFIISILLFNAFIIYHT